jgi:hypothetical protein
VPSNLGYQRYVNKNMTFGFAYRSERLRGYRLRGGNLFLLGWEGSEGGGVCSHLDLCRGGDWRTSLRLLWRGQSVMM